MDPYNRYATASVHRQFQISRRRLLGGATALGASALLGIGPLGRAAQRALAAGGRAAQADPVTALLEAYVSTLVPGPADDPEGTPGAVEAGGVGQILALVPYVVPLLVTDLSAVSLSTYGSDFPSLAYPDREALLVDAFADDSRSPYHLIALAIGAGTFYGDFVNRVGGEHLGFPGPSNGYLSTYTDRTGHGQPQAEAVPA